MKWDGFYAVSLYVAGLFCIVSYGGCWVSQSECQQNIPSCHEDSFQKESKQVRRNPVWCK
jgi:hypothetical protein